MTLIDPLADALTNIKNHENAAKKLCLIKPAGKMLKEVLKLMQAQGYINTFEKIEDGRQGIFKIELNGTINECKAIKPRFAVKKDEFEKYELKYLPSREIGCLIISTSKGILTHKQAKEMKIGGRLLATIF